MTIQRKRQRPEPKENHLVEMQNLQTAKSQELEFPTSSIPKEQNSIQSDSVTMDKCAYQNYQESQKKRREK